MTTLAGRTIPPLFTSGNPFPNFNISPCRIIDQEHISTGSGAPFADFRFQSNGFIRYFNADFSFTFPVDQPQWRDDGLTVPTYSVRWVFEDPASTGTMGPSFPPINVWQTINTNIQFDIARPAPSTSEFIRVVCQLALTSDLSTICAQATIGFTYNRP